MRRIISIIMYLFSGREHKFTIMWCLSDKDTNERTHKDFIISSVGVVTKDDIHNKRMINKSVSEHLEITDKIRQMVLNGEVKKDSKLSYNIICYYGRMKK